MNIVHKILVVLPAAAALLILSAQRTDAGDGCCDRCGCGQCRKVCRLVCDEKELEVTCWDSKCEDFCLPGPCKLGCKHRVPACADCAASCANGNCASACDGHGGSCSAGISAYGLGKKKFVWRDSIPGCARIFTKKILLKKVEKKKVRTYKWVLEDLCSNCQSRCDSVSVPPGTPIPEVPPEATADDVTMIPAQVEPLVTEIKLMKNTKRFSISD